MIWNKIYPFFSLLFAICANLSWGQANDSTEVVSGQAMEAAPVVSIVRDDHVATIEMDYDASAGWGGQLWTVGTDGQDACGYRIQWWPDAAAVPDIDFSVGCGSDQNAGTSVIATTANPHQVVTANRVVQIQPIANDANYHILVEKINAFGQVCSPATELTFSGGDGARVAALRSSMTFFDDFNLPHGPADELLWNNAMGPQTDSRFNLFFINHQCHVHTLNGTSNEGSGDRSQVAQRARKPILIEPNVRRRIVFDMDGIFSGRSVWYLDFNPVPTDLMGHLSFFDDDGDTGLPADVFRIRAQGHDLSVSLIDHAGSAMRIASAYLPDFGRAMATNVRRSFDVRLGTDGVTISVDGTEVMDASFPVGTFKAGKYYPLWSTVGYNTSKDDNPYFLSHWDNFGFDGPDVDTMAVHNYVTRIAGTDLQKANEGNNQTPTFTVQVPDDIRPTTAGVTHEVWLVFSYLKDDFTTFKIEPGDHFLFNGTSFPLPEGANNSTPLVPELVDYAGSPISNRIKIGEVQLGGQSPLLVGNNTIQFFATNTGIMNVHVEVLYPQDATAPPYTAPADIHPFVFHHDLPKLGPPARIVYIDDQEWSEEEDGTLMGPSVSDSMTVEILVGNGHWAGWAPQLLHMPATSAELWSTGSAPGIQSVHLYLRPLGAGDDPGTLIATLNSSETAPAPQIRYEFAVAVDDLPSDTYQLFVQATNTDGIKSHPGYDGFGFTWDATELSGAYLPVQIEIDNGAAYVFNGTNGPLWTNEDSWEKGTMPPPDCQGTIIINADCEVPATHDFAIDSNCVLIVNPEVVLEVKR